MAGKSLYWNNMLLCLVSFPHLNYKHIHMKFGSYLKVFITICDLEKTVPYISCTFCFSMAYLFVWGDSVKLVYQKDALIRSVT